MEFWQNYTAVVDIYYGKMTYQTLEEFVAYKDIDMIGQRPGLYCLTGFDSNCTVQRQQK